MADNFDRKRRNKVETVFSVIKRRFGDEIKAEYIEVRLRN